MFGIMRADQKMGSTDSVVDRKPNPSNLDRVTQTQNLISGQVEALYESVQLQNELVKSLAGEKDMLLYQLAEARSQHLKSRVEQGEDPVRTRSASVCFSQACTHQPEIEKLKSKISELQAHSKRLENIHDRQKKRLEMENAKCSNEVKKMKEDKKAFIHEIRRLGEVNEKLLKEKNEIEEKCRSLEGNMHDLSSGRVLLFTGNQQTYVDDVSSEIGNMLSFKMESRGVKIRVERCTDPQTHHNNTPLLVLCIHASRLGTDVHHALQSVKCDRSVALVVLHHKEYHALPSQPSEKLLVGGHYRQLGVIVDIAFLKSKGVYTCDMNDRSLDKLCSFIFNIARQI
ncbi:uncharacterized protein [Argopecten irradians]|uniref:uncharacterized protein n=1 Tax=Argopecten irradians TaxID=31199 RepID=UPI0037249365